jgi:hypothetical protein
MWNWGPSNGVWYEKCVGGCGLLLEKLAFCGVAHVGEPQSADLRMTSAKIAPQTILVQGVLGTGRNQGTKAPMWILQ